MTVSTHPTKPVEIAPAPAHARQPGAGRPYREQTWFLAALLLTGAALCAWTWGVTTPARADALPSVLFEIATFTGILVALTLRDPERRLRLSNPALSVLGWMFYYFIKPALTWLQGYRLAYESGSTILLDAGIVANVQYLHIYFMGAFFVAYTLVAPSSSVRAIFTAGSQPRLPVAPFLALGLSSFLAMLVERVITTGSILPSASYGELWAQNYDSTQQAREAGGADYLVTQVYSKIWYFPTMALGLGLGVLLARYATRRQWLGLVGVFGLAPVLLLLGEGGRSNVAYPFLIAILIGDSLAGPYRWWRFVPLVALALKAFDFYGFYRGHQHQGVREAVDASMAQIEGLQDRIETEDSTMLTKEAYCIFVSDHGREYRGVGYFYDTLIQLLPGQLAPEKRLAFNTSNFLSNEFIGYTRRGGGGTAGAILGDGYFMGGTLGVIALAVVLGVTLGLVVRWGMSGDGGRPVLWRYLLMLMICVQTTHYIRADYSVVLVQILYYVVIPAVAMRLAMEAGFLRDSPWNLRLEVARPGRR